MSTLTTRMEDDCIGVVEPGARGTSLTQTRAPQTDCLAAVVGARDMIAPFTLGPLLIRPTRVGIEKEVADGRSFLV